MSKEKTKQLHKDVAPFAKSDKKKSIMQIINTVPPFLLLWFFAYQSLSVSIWLTLGICCHCSRICYPNVHHFP